METTHDINEQLIGSYLSGTISPDEEQQLLSWLEQSEENKRQFFEMKALWNARQVAVESLDMASFARFMRQTNARVDDSERRKSRIRMRSLWYAAAAVAVLLVTAGGLWHLFDSPKAFEIYTNSTPGIKTITLNDGSQVWLNANSTLTLPQQFDTENRRVELSGSAFFDIARNEEAPFSVQTRNLQIRVLGTAFCVNAEKESDLTKVVLERGSVQLLTAEGHKLVKLHPDQCATYDAQNGNLEIEQVNASYTVLAQYDLVTMENATLHEIISRLETTYGVRISAPNRYDSKRYAFNFQRSNTIENVLKIVEYMTGEKCEIVYRRP